MRFIACLFFVPINVTININRLSVEGLVKVLSEMKKREDLKNYKNFGRYFA
jgi:hypothetical protein